MTPANQTNALNNPIAQSVQSLRNIDRNTANPPPANQIDVVTVRNGDTASGLAQQNAFPSHKQERFLILNAISAAGDLQAGREVKLVR